MADAAQSATLDTQLFRDVFAASPIGIAVENLEGQPLFVNPAICSFLGISEEELRESTVSIFLRLKTHRRIGRFFSNCERV
jgi:PAS domain S-box-containing protein